MENEKHLGIWLPMSVFAPVCGLAQFFGLGNRVIISVLDGFPNVMLFQPKLFPRKHNYLSSFLAWTDATRPSFFWEGRSLSKWYPLHLSEICALRWFLSMWEYAYIVFGVYISLDLSFLHGNTVFCRGKKIMGLVKQHISFTCLFLLGIGCCVMNITGTLRSVSTLLMQYEPITLHTSPGHPGRSRRF